MAQTNIALHCGSRRGSLKGGFTARGERGVRMASARERRGFLKSDDWERWQELEIDQRKGLPAPPTQKPCPEGAKLIDLVALEDVRAGDFVENVPVAEAMFRRRSRRRFTDEQLSLAELSFLLLATQGVTGRSGNRRTVPSAGARHPLESYVGARCVEGLEPGLYRYLPLDHKLCLLREDKGLPEALAEACNDQGFVAAAAVVFVWAAVPYRSEYRYGILSHKLIALDAGHVCQNLYLACEAVGAGTCGIAAYNQRKIDAVLGLDGDDEFTVYCASVGKVRREE